MSTTGTRPDLTSYLAQQIVELIRRDDLAPGDRLPPAKALAATFSVATPTLREALRRLQATGVIDIRHGSGIYVRRDHERLMFANPHARNGDLADHTILDLLDARLMIEPQLAELAAERAADDDLANLERLLLLAEEQLVGHDNLLGKTNMAFHAAIARSSRNQVLAQVMESLIEIYSSEQFAILSLYNARDRDHRDHRRIYAAIRNRTGAIARDRMHRHLTEVREVVAGRMEE
ncbi:MAG: FadR/GntR family transcriptional regulator [Thermomicrobiales bacterium]